MSQSVYNRVRAALNEYGVLVGMALAVNRMLAQLGTKNGLFWYCFYQQPVSSELLVRHDTDLCFLWLDQYEAVLAQLPRPEENLRARFLQDVKCLAVVKQGELIGCAWFAFGQYREDEVYCTYLLTPDAVWDFDVYVIPRYRLGRTFARIWQAANAQLAELGVACTFSRISAYNRQSIRSHERLGATHVGTAIFLRLGWLQLMVASQKPLLSISVGDRRSPRIEFHAV